MGFFQHGCSKLTYEVSFHFVAIKFAFEIRHIRRSKCCCIIRYSEYQYDVCFDMEIESDI